MRRSPGSRLFGLGLLTLFMFIPLFFVAALIEDRGNHAREAVRSIGGEWGGSQTLIGPFLSIPVQGTVQRQDTREVVDPRTGEVTYEIVTIEDIGPTAPLILLPNQFDLDIVTSTQTRRRGIFRVPVYTADSTMAFDFDIPDTSALLHQGETIQWDEARLIIGLSDTRALRGETALTVDGETLRLDPRGDGTGIQANVGDPRSASAYSLSLSFNGAGELRTAPIGRSTNITLSSDWPHPSFDGAFLPTASEINEDGFRAEWSIPHLARNLPEASRSSIDSAAQRLSFGLRYYEPNDFYQKAFRAARYSILFIGLTFLTVFLTENRSTRPVHPVQYILIGLAQALFVVLMTAYAEQFGFGVAYALSAGATIGLITAFGHSGLGLGRATWVLGAALIVIYGALYMILRSTDYALLAGSTLAFAALAATIYATRNEDWYGPDRPKTSWFSRVSPSQVAPPPTGQPEASA